jgi:hypothetical protein
VSRSRCVGRGKQCRGNAEPDKMMCQPCTDHGETIVKEIPWLLSNLRIEQTRQGSKKPPGGPNSSSGGKPLPIDLAATDILDDLERFLRGWFTVPGRPKRTPRDLAHEHIDRYPTRAATSPLIGTYLAALREIRHRAERVIDLPRDREWLGVCATPVWVIEWEEQRRQVDGYTELTRAGQQIILATEPATKPALTAATAATTRESTEQAHSHNERADCGKNFSAAYADQGAGWHIRPRSDSPVPPDLPDTSQTSEMLGLIRLHRMSELVLSPTVRDDICESDLYAPAGARAVSCRACGAQHDARTRRARLGEQASEHLATLEDVVRILPRLLDAPISADTVRSWAKRGKISPQVGPWAGARLFLVSDFVTMARASRSRQA